MDKKALTLTILGALIFAVFLITQPQNTNALQQKTVQEALGAVGKFMGESPKLLDRALISLKDKEFAAEELIAKVNGWPITFAELEFRRSLSEASGLGSSDYNDIFNTLVEEKVILSYAEKNNILPTEEEVKAFIQQEKEYYEEPNSQYRKSVDAILRGGKMTTEDYWDRYEWYNAFRLLALDKSYKEVLKEAQAKGELPLPQNGIDQETAKQFEDYWLNFKKELKAKASIEIINDMGLELNPKLNELFM